MDDKTNARAIVRMVHEPTGEVHRETVVLDDHVFVYGFRRDSMGFNSIRVGQHMECTPTQARALVAKFTGLADAVTKCECDEHRDYRMEVDAV